MYLIRSPAYFSLSIMAFLGFLGWLIVEIIGHSYSDIITDNQNALVFNEITLQLFMYTTLLTTVCLATSWYADFTRTRASRNMSLTASTFTVFAWMWNLWFVIPAFRRSDDTTNLFCSGGLDIMTRWCDLNRAAAAFCTVLEFVMFLTWVVDLAYYFALRTPEIPIPTKATILAPHHSLVDAAESGAHDADVAWNTELTEPDDLELMKITANNPSTHAAISQRVTGMGHVTSFFTFLSLLGWLILTCSLIDVARTIGLQGWQTTEDTQYTPNVNTAYPLSGTNRLGDPIVAGNWYWLTLSLGITLCASSYSAHRRNRGIIGGALLLSILSTLQWMSLFIYMCRRVNEQNDDNATYAISSLSNARHSQDAEVAGAGIITLGELIRCLVLFARYMTYMMVTKLDHDRVHIPSHVDAPTVVQAERDYYNPNYANSYGGTAITNPQQDYTTAHQTHAHAPATEVNVPGPAYDAADADLYVPSYNMGIFHGSSIGFRFIFAMQCLTLLAWWVMQVVQEANSGIFVIYGNNPEAGSNVVDGLNTPEAPDRSYWYNEYMFLLSTALVIGAYLPAFYAEREASVSAALASMYTSALMCLGFFLLVWTFSYESIYGNGTLYSDICTQGGSQWCRMTQAAGIFALINAFFLLCIFCHSVTRLAERRMMINVYERSVQNTPSFIAPLIIAAIGIWSFTQLYYGLFSNGVVQNLQSLNGVQSGRPIRDYFASQAFLTFATCAAAVWLGTYASKLLYAWQSWSWRMVSLVSSMIAAAFLVPLIIYAGRFIYNGSLSNADLTLASAIIILCAGTAFYFAAFTFLVHTAFYASGPAGAALPPTGMALKGRQQFVKNEVVRDVELGTVAGTGETVAVAGPAYNRTTTARTTAEPVVNPRTGETAVAVDQYPTDQPVYAGSQPVQYTAMQPQSVYNVTTVPVGGSVAGNQVIYHDE